MKEKVAEAISKVYFKKEYDFFKILCNEKLYMLDKFCEVLKKSIRYIEVDPHTKNPAREWYVYFKIVKEGDFSIKYNTVIKVSKIVPVFYIQHEFEVENRDKNRIGPFLEGYSGEAYCRSQFELHENVRKFLNTKGFEELSYAEMKEVICGLNMPKGTTIFGKQMTVETALFRDVFDLCSESVAKDY
ncbi:MAG: hypothetical protein ACRC76_02425 [Proteocatella sp.]